MWALLLAKYWQYGLIVALVGAMFTMNACHKHKVEGMEQEYMAAIAYGEAKAAQLNECNASIDRQNAAIRQLEQDAIERQAELDELLAKPPRVIYRDKIVEVPSIVTGPCEQVVDDIASYIMGVLQ
jgi:hypothetical protein